MAAQPSLALGSSSSARSQASACPSSLLSACACAETCPPLLKLRLQIWHGNGAGYIVRFGLAVHVVGIIIHYYSPFQTMQGVRWHAVSLVDLSSS